MRRGRMGGGDQERLEQRRRQLMTTSTGQHCQALKRQKGMDSLNSELQKCDRADVPYTSQHDVSPPKVRFFLSDDSPRKSVELSPTLPCQTSAMSISPPLLEVTGTIKEKSNAGTCHKQVQVTSSSLYKLPSKKCRKTRAKQMPSISDERCSSQISRITTYLYDADTTRLSLTWCTAGSWHGKTSGTLKNPPDNLSSNSQSSLTADQQLNMNTQDFSQSDRALPFSSSPAKDTLLPAEESSTESVDLDSFPPNRSISQVTEQCKISEIKTHPHDICSKVSKSKQKRMQHLKPPYSYVAMIIVAIQHSPYLCLTLEEIIDGLYNMFPTYQVHLWKESIHHRLTNRPCFVKVISREQPTTSRSGAWQTEWDGAWQVKWDKVPTNVFQRKSSCINKNGNSEEQWKPTLQQHLEIPDIILPLPSYATSPYTVYEISNLPMPADGDEIEFKKTKQSVFEHLKSDRFSQYQMPVLATLPTNIPALPLSCASYVNQEYPVTNVGHTVQNVSPSEMPARPRVNDMSDLYPRPVTSQYFVPVFYSGATSSFPSTNSQLYSHQHVGFENFNQQIRDQSVVALNSFQSRTENPPHYDLNNPFGKIPQKNMPLSSLSTDKSCDSGSYNDHVEYYHRTDQGYDSGSYGNQFAHYHSTRLINYPAITSTRNTPTQILVKEENSHLRHRQEITHGNFHGLVALCYPRMYESSNVPFPHSQSEQIPGTTSQLDTLGVKTSSCDCFQCKSLVAASQFHLDTINNPYNLHIHGEAVPDLNSHLLKKQMFGSSSSSHPNSQSGVFANAQLSVSDSEHQADTVSSSPYCSNYGNAPQSDVFANIQSSVTASQHQADVSSNPYYDNYWNASQKNDTDILKEQISDSFSQCYSQTETLKNPFSNTQVTSLQNQSDNIKNKLKLDYDEIVSDSSLVMFKEQVSRST